MAKKAETVGEECGERGEGRKNGGKAFTPERAGEHEGGGDGGRRSWTGSGYHQRELMKDGGKTAKDL